MATGAPFTSLPIYNAATASTTPPPPPTRSQPPSTTVTFRLLCHSSRIGGIIGKSGHVIKHLQHATSSTIRIHDSPPESEFRVVSITGDSAVTKTMTFGEELEESGEEYRDVSDAQEALVRVFERVLDVAAEADGCYEGVVSCRMLTRTSSVGGIIGKGGKVVEKIREDTGCRIRVFSHDKLHSSDEMIEIEGGIVAVKKALIAVSRRIQDCPPADKPRMSFGKPDNRFNREPVVPNMHTDHYPLTRPQNGSNPMPPNMHMDHQNQRYIGFRMLCTRELVGGIIGNGGAIVRAFENQTGAAISVAYPVSNSNERLITITAAENPESPNSPTQNAVILVFGRSVETAYERGLDTPLSGMPVSARLVIPHYQTGCLLGKGGSIMADTRKVTGAIIRIVSGNNFPGCASETDDVVLMTGKFVSVRDALFSITTRLRNHMFTSGPKTNGRPPFEQHSSLTTNHFSQHASLTQSMDNLRLSNTEQHHPSSSGPCQSQAGSSSGTSGIELGRGGRSAIITNTSLEIMVPQNDIGCVYGDNGSNLTRIRQISGANVVVHEPSSRKGDYVIVISGSPDQTQSAQSLLRAFLLADQDLDEGQDCN